MSDRIARVWSGSDWEVVTSTAASPNAVAYYQPTAPSNPTTGQVWVDEDDLNFYIWDGSSWVNTPTLSSYQSSEPASPVSGQIWIDSDDNKMYVWSGSAWINISVDLSAYAQLSGATFTGTISGQHINPSATNTYDLGTSSLRWRNIYTQDLHLSNGIGDYTIVEGEENLYLTNNKTGKFYKFSLIEVDSSEVPQKSES